MTSALRRPFMHAATELGRPLLAITIALLVGLMLIGASGHDVGAAYGQLLHGAVGSRVNVAESLRIATTLIFMSLAFTFALRAGMFNAGTQGQFLIGAFGAAWVGFTFTGLPGFAIILLAFLAGAVGGAIWAAGPGLLRALWGVNEIVTTLMMTFVAILLTEYLIFWRFQSGQGGETTSTEFIAGSAHLHRLLPPGSFTWAIFLALALVGFYVLMMRYTVLGYELKIAGSNPKFAAYGGITLRRTLLVGIVASGVIAGLGGAQEILGVHHRFISRFSPDVGFNGIVASLLGRNHPVGIVLASLFLGGLQNGAFNMELFANVPRSIVKVLTALIVMLAVATTQPWRRGRRSRPVDPQSRRQPEALEAEGRLDPSRVTATSVEKGKEE